MANKKIFEDLEKKGDEEMLKDMERPAGKARVYKNKKRSKAAQKYREQIGSFLVRMKLTIKYRKIRLNLTIK